MEGSDLRDQANLTMAATTKEVDIDPLLSTIDGRERIKIEFYKTYDVMTGIRIAATLGGFFSMMILLLLYKNYCKPSKTLSEEQLNAAVTAAVEEEDRALKAALEATSFYTSLSKQRESIANEHSAIISPRFSSVGGGCSHLAPPMRFSYLQQRGKSLPGSALRFSSEEKHERSIKNSEEEKEGPEGDRQLPDYVSNSNHLSVPADRRLSSITCSSADTSYLERRGSAFEMGRPVPPCFVRNDLDKEQIERDGPWDFYYPIDIQVIQPTPEMSPAASTETLCEKPNKTCALQVPGFHDRIHRLSADSSDLGLAPLASISSLASLSNSANSTMSQSPSNSGTIPEYAANANDDSLGSDSVFMDEEVDTEDEVEEFSTDSEFDYGGFDDDYSFCESSKRPVSRCQKRSLQFASFDSYDASIGQDTLSEDGKNARDKTAGLKQSAADFRRQQDGNRTKRKLCKTLSEPRNQKIMRQLPPWIERGRSGYIPKRQLSVPASKRKTTQRENVHWPNAETDKTCEAACELDGCCSYTGSQGSEIQQGYHKDLPSVKSFEKYEDKRRRFQKQKTVDDWDVEERPVSSNLLRQTEQR